MECARMEMLSGHPYLWLAGLAGLLIALALLLFALRRRAKRLAKRAGPWGGGPWDKFK